MASEAKRGCGYRKVGGLYLRGQGAGMPCDRLPLALTVCPCCSHGFKQTRGWTWVDINLLVGGVHRNCADEFPCPLCMATSEMGKVGLLWIGEKFYPTVEAFLREADTMGISRRIAAVPRGFKVGETWVLLAHPKGIACRQCGGAGLSQGKPCELCNGTGRSAAIFRVFRPHAVEIIVTDAQSKDETFMEGIKARGLTPVVVPDNDVDHRGTVYEDENGE